jgi:hypothetical protein
MDLITATGLLYLAFLAGQLVGLIIRLADQVVKKYNERKSLNMKNILFSMGFVLLYGSQALAVDFFTVPTLATENLGTMATAILAALALIWAVRKGVKMINRS